MSIEDVCIRWCLGLAAAGVLVSSLELLWLHREFRKGAVVLALLLGRGLTAAVCVWHAINGAAPGCSLALLVGIELGFRLRARDMSDGAEQMLTIAIITSWIATGYPSTAMLFLAAQLSTAYLAAGFAKLRHTGWITGEYPAGVMSTNTFGLPRELRWLIPDQRTTAPFARLLIACEVVFGLGPWLPPVISVPVLGMAVLFHLAIAVMMGLNRFLFGFGAAIAAGLYTSQWLYR